MKTFDDLFTELRAKVALKEETSGTYAAVQEGVHVAGRLVLQEAAEAWMATEHESKERSAEEIAQLLYQVQVLMLANNLTLHDVYEHL